MLVLGGSHKKNLKHIRRGYRSSGFTVIRILPPISLNSWSLRDDIRHDVYVIDYSGYFRGLRRASGPRYNEFVMRVRRNSNSHLPECWLHFLVGPRRYRAVLPSNRRPSLFGGD
jgi:hypothetical protein